jgi:hypothetical protein
MDNIKIDLQKEVMKTGVHGSGSVSGPKASPNVKSAESLVSITGVLVLTAPLNKYVAFIIINHQHQHQS